MRNNKISIILLLSGFLSAASAQVLPQKAADGDVDGHSYTTTETAGLIIPEVGIKVEPGPKSEGYVTNIEGVLTRFETAVKKALNLFDDEESQKNGKNALEHIQELKKGNGTATLIILDPFGQSNVVSENVEVLEIPEEELHGLKTGFSVIEDN